MICDNGDVKREFLSRIVWFIVTIIHNEDQLAGLRFPVTITHVCNYVQSEYEQVDDCEL